MVTGSWDATCKVWDLTDFSCVKTLTDHTHAVTCEFLSNNILVTGSQNGILNFWNENFEKIKEVKAHENIIRKIVTLDDCFVTCSNDSHVKIFDFEGNLVNQFKQHESFIYSLCTVKDGFASAGEDFKVNFYNKKELIYSLPHPSIVWDMFYCD